MRITWTQFNEFKQKFNAGAYPGQRFGQAFENTFARHSGEHSPCVFYIKDSQEAENLIAKYYVGWDEVD